MRVIRAVLKLVAAAVVLAAAAWTLLFALNRGDEPLGERARALIAEARSAPPAAENGWFAVMGWRAPEGADPHAFGLQGHERWLRAGHEERVRNEAVAQLPFPAREALCHSFRPDCLQTVAADPGKFAAVLSEHRTLVGRLGLPARYRYLRNPWVEGKVDEPVRVAPYYELMRLGTTQSALDWVEGRHAAALEGVALRAQAARLALRDAGDAVHLLLAEGWLRSEVALLAEMMARDPLAVASHEALAARTLRPLEAAELGGALWLKGEFATTASTLAEVRETAAAREWVIGDLMIPELSMDVAMGKPMPLHVQIAIPLLSPLLQPGATANRLAEQIDRHARRLAQPAAVLAKALEPAPPGDPRPWLTWRNPVGEWYLASPHRPRPWAYGAARHDLDRFVRLAGLQLELLRHGVTVAAVPAFLAQSPLALDPAKGERVQWDAGRRELWIEPLTARWAEPARQIGSVPGRIGLAYRAR